MANFWSFSLLCLQFCILVSPSAGDVCKASIWSKRGKGSFFDTVNWKEKNAPEKNEVVVISSASEVTVSKKKASVGTLIMEGSSLVLEGEGASLDIVGKMDCKDGDCPAIGQFYESTVKQRRVCPARDSNYQYICNAAVWKPNLKDGSYSDAENWVSGNVPKPTDIVFLGGNDVRQLDYTVTAGDFVATTGNLWIYHADLIVEGDMECKGSTCKKDYNTKLSFDRGDMQQCPIITTTTTTTTTLITGQCAHASVPQAKSDFTIGTPSCNKNLPPKVITVDTEAGYIYKIQFRPISPVTIVNLMVAVDNGEKHKLKRRYQELKTTANQKDHNPMSRVHFEASTLKTTLTFSVVPDGKKCIPVTISSIKMFKCKPTPKGCKKTCQGQTCDYWASEENYSCHVLERDYGCNCNGCKCAVDKGTCGKDKCDGKTCDEWTQLGVSCDYLKKEKKCTCSLCKCGPPKPQDCLIITGIYKISAGGANGVELYARCDVDDLSRYTIHSSLNGEGFKRYGKFPKKKLEKKSFFYITNNFKKFATFFRFPADISFDLRLDGDDAVVLKMDQHYVVDTFGDVIYKGESKFDYTNGYAYRKDKTGPDKAKFTKGSWSIHKSVLKQSDGNGGAKRYGGKFPVSTYCRAPPCIRLTTTTTTTSTTTTTARLTTTSTTTSTTTTTTLTGCTNKKACNYNKNAKGDDGSCKLPKACHDCKGKCICQKDICGVCGGKGPGSDMKNCGSKKGVQVSWIKDGTCDDAHNICVCGWDGGDCCGEKNDYKFCKKCKCQDPSFKKDTKKGDCGDKCSGKCAKPSYTGDGYCDDDNNNCGCGWDKGDCCGIKNNYDYCDKKKGCKCRDCKFKHKGDKCVKKIKNKCGNLKWKGDKNCDDNNNNAGCNWDGGDCCGKNNYAFCKECKCKDCTYVTKGDKCINNIKGGCGAKNYVGDKHCDDNNNNAGCNWDKGDCCGPKNNYDFCKACKCLDCTFEAKGDACVKAMKKGCGAPKWKGDGNCDDNNNNAGCSWDGGDCCGAKNYAYCKKCKCLDCTYEAKGDACIKDMKKSCGAPKFKGDKYCDDSNNFAGCQWDGGDCCGPANNYKYCKECQCRDCTSKHKKTCPGKAKGCKAPNYKGDKNCDDVNNNCRCSWDGGDCCAKSNGGSVKKKYCKACKCLDPDNQQDPNCKGSCGAAGYKGDGNCDDENNNCGCQYDGGDCCKKSLGKPVKTKYCKVCKCIDPKNLGDPNCKGHCKYADYKGDGNCDDENNNCGCEYDGGDCCKKSLGKPVNKKYCKACKCIDPKNQGDPNCKGSCGASGYKGDGNCDDNNNNCGCDYDGGDCCKLSLGKPVNKKYCKECKCLDPKNQADANCKGTCKYKDYKGDGNCDDENNNCGCQYDGGDCCEKTSKKKPVNKKYCKVCKCLDPKAQPSGNCKGTCGAKSYKGDGNCDDNNNNCGCDYDGGDCCEKTLKKPVKKKYCKKCECLDPKGK